MNAPEVSSVEQDDRGAAVLEEIRTTMQGCDWRLEAVLCFGGPQSVAVQVYAKAEGSKRYAKVGPYIFAPDGGTIADTLRMLGELAAKETAAERESVTA